MTLTELAEFHFLRPLWLLLIPLVILVAKRIATRSHTAGNWKSYIDAELGKHLLDNGDFGKESNTSQWIARLIVASLCVALLALAGPSWQRLPQPLFVKQDTLVVIADLTLSMHTQDIAPSRFTRMRYKLLELFKQRKEGQTALIVYSGDAHVLSPLTEDSNTIAALVPALSPEIMPSIGSNAVAAFQLAEQLLRDSAAKNSRIVWLTDELLAQEEERISRLLKNTGSELFVIGIGTSQGGPVPLPSGSFLKDPQTGHPVTAKLNRSALASFARDNAGSYLELSADNSDIQRVLADSPVATSQQGESEAQLSHDQWLDRGVDLLPLLLPALLLSFRRGVLLSLPLTFALALSQPTPAMAQSSSDNSANSTTENSSTGLIENTWQRLWKNNEQRAYDHYRRGEYQQARELFDSDSWQAVASYAEKDFKQAEQGFARKLKQEQTGESVDAHDMARAHYNHGHALAHNGKLEQAIEAYKKSLIQDPDFGDAQRSLAIIEQLLEQQQQSEQNQQSSQSQQESSGEQSGEQNAGQPTPTEANNQANNDSDEPASQSQNQTAESRSGEQQKPSQTQQVDREEQREAEKKMAEHGKNSEPTDSEDLAASNELTEGEAEQHAQLQQWLNRIEDDPSGLLRRKFQYERELRERQGSVVESGNDVQLW